ncbi:MAG: hypothetical protein R8P61_19710 [Bacteroidia bacterium]|nr:hypothetical protein [Bacteroidia bacterium]
MRKDPKNEYIKEGISPSWREFLGFIFSQDYYRIIHQAYLSVFKTTALNLHPACPNGPDLILPSAANPTLQLPLQSKLKFLKKKKVLKLNAMQASQSRNHNYLSLKIEFSIKAIQE